MRRAISCVCFWLATAVFVRVSPLPVSHGDAPVWPWMGETFLDGFLEKDAVRLTAYLGALRDIGCEELTDLLLVETVDLEEMGMSPLEIDRFARGVAEIRRWQDHQDEYATQWGSLNDDVGDGVGRGEIPGSDRNTEGSAVRQSEGRNVGPSSRPPEWRESPVFQPESSASELDGWGLVAGDRDALRSPLHWRQRPVAALLGFMDQSQQMVTESGKLDLKSMRAIQAMKSLSASLSDTIQNLDKNFGIDLATMRVDGILRLKENPAELQKFISQNAHRVAGELSESEDVVANQGTSRTGGPSSWAYSTSSDTDAWSAVSVLIEHVRKSIRKATIGVSKLSGEALAVEGMSSSKVRHLLNNLCNLKGTRYLEIGSYKGSTLVAAVVGNEETLVRASAIDDFSQFGGPRQAFWDNVDAHIHPKLRFSNRFLFVEEDAFTDAALEELAKPLKLGRGDGNSESRSDSADREQYNVYMYDGGHTVEDHRRAFTHIKSLLAPLFIVVIDDWNQEQAKGGSREAFLELGWTVVYETELPSRGNGDEDLWWNGLAVAIVQK